MTRYPMILMALPLVLGGCFLSDAPPVESPTDFYCQQTEDFRYTQAELDARAPWPQNLAREFRVNERRDLWCDPTVAP